MEREDIQLLRRAYGCIDNTSLEGLDTGRSIDRLCRRSVELQAEGVGPVASVCVYPRFVALAKRLLEGSGIGVASVAGAFPHGQVPVELKVAEVRYVVEQGADEVDMVLSRGLVVDGDLRRAADEVAAVRAACPDARLKVILETGELQTAERIRAAATAAIEGGADFIKTSTGKTAVGATPEAAEVMLESINK